MPFPFPFPFPFPVPLRVRGPGRLLILVPPVAPGRIAPGRIPGAGAGAGLFAAGRGRGGPDSESCMAGCGRRACVRAHCRMMRTRMERGVWTGEGCGWARARARVCECEFETGQKTGPVVVRKDNAQAPADVTVGWGVGGVGARAGAERKRMRVDG